LELPNKSKLKLMKTLLNYVPHLRELLIIWHQKFLKDQDIIKVQTYGVLVVL